MALFASTLQSRYMCLLVCQSFGRNLSKICSCALVHEIVHVSDNISQTCLCVCVRVCELLEK